MELKKELTLLDVFCISTGAMLSGLFILPGLAYELAGPGMLASYVIAAALALTGLLSQAELSSAMPKAGGTYFYVTRSMGSAVGTVYGLITWLSMSLKSAYELFFMATFLAALVSLALPPQIIAVILCAAFLAINFLGAKEAGRLQAYLVLGLLIVLALFCVLCYRPAHADNLSPFAPHGGGSILAAAGFVFVSFGGLLKVASIAEEVKDPGRVLPLGMILSLLVVFLAYVAVVFAVIEVLGPDLAGQKMPLSAAASVFLGKAGGIIFSIAAMLAIVSSANAGIMAASRYPLALARDEMLPAILGRINRRFNTPHISIIVTGVIIAAAFFVDTTMLVKAASSVLVLTYVFTCAAVIILRESGVQNYKPQFRSPLYPWVQIIGILGFNGLLFALGYGALVATSVLVILGFGVYWFYGRDKASREYALLHLIERITSHDLTSHHLETELKEIIHERDDILKDRFDHLIEQCPVLDIDGPISRDDFFKQAADALAGDLKMTSEVIQKQFDKREEESTTVLNPFLAIPHIVIPGKERFDVLLVRCREGIHFSNDAPAVHTVFVLIGTKDERNFHLLSLAAIAQIVQEDDFEARWMAAQNEEAMRDIVLLGKRRRH